MKTKIITLESHDDLISLRDKLSWAKTPRILLALPKYEKVSLRLLDLKVLQRHADSLGAQLGLVTKRMNVRRDAESLGIPVFATTLAAQKDVWAESPPRTQRTPKPPRRDLRAKRDETYVKEPAWRTSLLGRVVAFTAGVMAVLVMAGLFVPRAEVTLNPEARDVILVIPVSASAQTESVSLSGEIPAREISVFVSEEQTVPVLNRVSIPKEKAAGVVQFTNLGAEELLIPAGTVTATNTLIRFVTLNEARLPGGLNKIVEVKIEAEDAGDQGNVPAGAINIIQGALGLSVKVTNFEPAIGGTNEEAPGASDEERAALREKVSSALLSKAEEQIRASLGAGDLFIADTLKLIATQREGFSPLPGEPGAELTLSTQAQFSARYILAEDIKALASSALAASIPQGFSPVGETTFIPLETPATDSSGVTRFSLQAAQDTRRIIDLAQVFSLLRGRDRQIAAAELQTALSLQNEPRIVVAPSWWRWLPLIPFNISVKVE